MRIQGIQGDTVHYRGLQPLGIIHEVTGDTRGYRGYKGIQYVTGGYSHRG